jgi:hypothetical protein
MFHAHETLLDVKHLMHAIELHPLRPS